MPQPSAAILPAFVPSALAASHVGTWRCDPSSGVMHCDAIMAVACGYDEHDGLQGIQLSDLRERIFPADRELFDQKNDIVCEDGGFIVMEFRVEPRPGEVRWLLIRGCYEAPSEVGALPCIGHGIAIDITDNRTGIYARGKPFLAVSSSIPVEESRPLARVIDTALDLHRQLKEVEDDVPAVRPLLDMILFELSRRLARDVPREDVS